MGLAVSKRLQQFCDQYNCMDLNKTFLYYLGVWPALDGRNGFAQKYYKCIPYIGLFVTCYGIFIATPITLYLGPRVPLLLCEAVSGLFIGSIYQAKAGCFVYRSETYQNLTRGLERLVERSGKSASAQKIKQRTHCAGVIVTSGTLLAIMVMMLVQATRIPSLLAAREYYFSGWTPSRDSPFYELLFLMWTYTIPYTSVIVTAIDAFLATFLIHLAGQFKILRHNLVQIHPASVGIVRDETMRERELHRVMEERLAECVRHHADIISLTAEFEEAFNVIFMDQIACNVGGILIAVLYMRVTPHIDMLALMHVGFAAGFLAELYVICWLANMVIDESEAVKEAVYGCDWFEASERFKRSMRIMMSMANQPVAIRVAGFIPLSIETFFNITHLTYTYYMTISTMLKERNLEHRPRTYQAALTFNSGQI